MKLLPSVCLLALAPAGLALSLPQDGEATVQASAQPADDGTSIFGEPLYVNGERITDMEIKRYLCYGKGRNALEARRLGTLMQQEWELRAYETREQLLADEYDGRAEDELSESERQELQAEVDRVLSKWEFNVEEYNDRLAKEEKSFYERYPTLDLDTEIARAYQSPQWYRDQVRQTLQFDDLFFKGHPDEWPALTLEAIHAGSPNFDLVEDYAKNHVLRLDLWKERRTETEAQMLAEHFGGKALEDLTSEEAERLKGLVDEVHGRWEPREDEMMMGLLRDYVMNALNDLVEIKTSIDGLPPHILMTVEGGGFRAELLTEDVYQEMKHAFTDHDIEEAKLFLALDQAVEDALIEQDALLSLEAFAEKFDGMAEELKDTMFQMEFLALQGHLFPSVEAYFDHLRQLESYRTLVADELELNPDGTAKPGMASHLPVANGIMGLAKAQAEVLLVSAFDYPTNSWTEGGWEKAEAKAMDLRAQIDAYLDKLAKQSEARLAAANAGENYTPEEELKPFDQWWSELLDLNSDYWDPPLPVTGKMPPAIGLKNRGRFQGSLMTRNDLKRALGESSYTHYLANFAIVDQIFFNMEEGTVAGPFLGPMGFYICYLKDRQPPTNPLSLRNERQLQMIQEDYLRVLFTNWAHEQLEKADVKGL